MTWQATVDKAVAPTVAGMGYDLVACEWLGQGLLRVMIDRLPGRTYETGPGEAVTVEDCERVTRQLQFVLEAEPLDYKRLEVSSPGLDRPLVKVADYERFVGHEIEVGLRVPMQGRKRFRGQLLRGSDVAQPAPWALVFVDGKETKVLGFALSEIREARLVPVIDFKRRRAPVDGGSLSAGTTTAQAIGEQEA